MNRRVIAAIAAAWIVSLVGVGVWAQQSGAPERVPARVLQAGENIGEIITGPDVGFQRVAAPNTPPGKIIGKLMVRVNGVWLEVQSSSIGIVR